MLELVVENISTKLQAFWMNLINFLASIRFLFWLFVWSVDFPVCKL